MQFFILFISSLVFFTAGKRANSSLRIDVEINPSTSFESLTEPADVTEDFDVEAYGDVGEHRLEAVGQKESTRTPLTEGSFLGTRSRKRDRVENLVKNSANEMEIDGKMDFNEKLEPIQVPPKLKFLDHPDTDQVMTKEHMDSLLAYIIYHYTDEDMSWSAVYGKRPPNIKAFFTYIWFVLNRVEAVLSGKHQNAVAEISIPGKSSEDILDNNYSNDNYSRSDKDTTTPRIIILGDTHGSLEDVLYVFSKYGPPSSMNKYLFNGDLVDRGCNAVEILTLLFGYMLVDPSSVTINRGNHEEQSVMLMYAERTFWDEIRHKFPSEVFGGGYKVFAGKIFHKFLNLFSYLPIATVIEKRIFTVHGGLGRTKPEQLLDILKTVSLEDRKTWSVASNPQNFSSVSKHFAVCDCLWSDPLDDYPNCGVDSVDSGRGETLVRWSERNTLKFLRENDFDLVLRSHDRPVDGTGCFMHHGGEESYSRENLLDCKNDWKVLTLFSASNYMDRGNTGSIAILTKDDILEGQEMKPELKGNPDGEETVYLKNTKSSSLKDVHDFGRSTLRYRKGFEVDVLYGCSSVIEVVGRGWRIKLVDHGWSRVGNNKVTPEDFGSFPNKNVQSPLMDNIRFLWFNRASHPEPVVNMMDKVHSFSSLCGRESPIGLERSGMNSGRESPVVGMSSSCDSKHHRTGMSSSRTKRINSVLKKRKHMLALSVLLGRDKMVDYLENHDSISVSGALVVTESVWENALTASCKAFEKHSSFTLKQALSPGGNESRASLDDAVNKQKAEHRLRSLSRVVLSNGCGYEYKRLVKRFRLVNVFDLEDDININLESAYAKLSGGDWSGRLNFFEMDFSTEINSEILANIQDQAQKPLLTPQEQLAILTNRSENGTLEALIQAIARNTIQIRNRTPTKHTEASRAITLVTRKLRQVLNSKVYPHSIVKVYPHSIVEYFASIVTEAQLLEDQSLLDDVALEEANVYMDFLDGRRTLSKAHFINWFEGVRTIANAEVVWGHITGVSGAGNQYLEIDVLTFCEHFMEVDTRVVIDSTEEMYLQLLRKYWVGENFRIEDFADTEIRQKTEKTDDLKVPMNRVIADLKIQGWRGVRPILNAKMAQRYIFNKQINLSQLFMDLRIYDSATGEVLLITSNIV